MEPKVSVIIPAYNVEKYIGECLESAVSQTLKEIEIIVLNDGSTDGTESVIKEYAERDPRIVAVSHSNMGLSATRNKGASLAKGKYLYFFDSDDFIDSNAMKVLYEAAERHQLQLVFGDKVVFYENEITYESVRTEKSRTEELPIRLLDPVAFISDLSVYEVVVWRYLIRKDYWEQLPFAFAVGEVYEDCEFTPKSVLSADRIGVIEYPIYYYRKRNQAFTMSGMNEKKLKSLVSNADRMDAFNASHIENEERKIYMNREIGNLVIQAAANAHLYRSMMDWDLRGWLKQRSKNLQVSPKMNHRLIAWGLRYAMHLTIFGLRLRYLMVYAKDRKMKKERIGIVEA